MNDTHESKAPTEQEGSAKFTQVKDTRGHIIPNLYRRNDRWYIQVHVPGKGCRRFMLKDEHGQPVTTVTAAKEAMVAFQQKKREGEMPTAKQAPFLDVYYKEYLTWTEETDAKDIKTVAKERGHLKIWAKFIGHRRLSDITTTDLRNFMLERSKKVKPAVVNNDIIALSNLMKFAMEEGRLKSNVTTKVKKLKSVPVKRELLSFDVLDKLCAEALRMEDGSPVYPSGVQCADWLKLIAFTGARRTAAMSAKWSNVNWTTRQIRLYTKFDKWVTVEFNAKLEAHLKDMQNRRPEGQPDWMFPSPRPGCEDSKGHFSSMQSTLEAVRERAGFPKFHVHLLRHAFISYAVMQGIPYMTIASWVGHSDGGVLIGRVYGHLNPAHKRDQANKLNLSDDSVHVATPSTQSPDLSTMSPQDLVALLQKAQTLLLQQAAGAIQPTPKAPVGA
jgi:integrase